MPHPELPTVSSTEIAAVAELASSLYGQRPVIDALERSGLSKAVLDLPPAQVANSNYVGFLEACARITGQPAFGACLGSQLHFKDLGPAGRYVDSANTLDLALTRLSKAVKYHAMALRIDYVPGPSVFRVVYYPPTPRALGSWHQCDGFTSLLINLVRRYEGLGWKPRKLMLPAAGGTRLSKLEAFFGTEIAPTDTVAEVFGSADLNHSIADSGQMDVAAPTWSELRQLIASQPSESYTEIVRELMKPIMRDGYFRLDQICARIGLEPRTLQRRLAREGQNFAVLQSDIRREWAEQLLTGSSLTLAEIGQQLGFSSSQHFNRAFKSWTGTSLGTYRKVQSQADRTAAFDAGWSE